MTRSAAAVLAAALIVGGCERLLVEPLPAPDGAVRLSFAAGSDEPVAHVLSKVNRLGVSIVRPGGGRRDTLVAVRHEGDGRVTARVGLEPRERVAGLQVSVQLGSEEGVLFRGAGGADAGGPGVAAARIVVEPVVASIVLSPLHVTLGALGDTARMEARGFFATGDPFPPIPLTWASADPAVAAVVGDGLFVARANGQTSVRAGNGKVHGAGAVRVRQIAMEVRAIAPADTTVAVGSSFRFRVDAVDRNGFRMPDSHGVRWHAGPGVWVDDSGMAVARVLGMTTVTARAPEGSASARVEVVPPEGLPQAELLWATREEGLVAGDLAGRYEPLGPMDARYPTRSPDDGWIAFVGTRGPFEYLYVSEVGGAVRELQTGANTSATWPEATADGRWILFARGEGGGRSTIDRIRPDGTGLETLTPPGHQGTMPTSSPDGVQIAYVSGADLVVQPLGGDPAVIVTGDRPRAPSWSPDGEWIAYSSGDGLVIVRPDGSERTRVPGFPAIEGFSWSPDGGWIVGGSGAVSLLRMSDLGVLPLGWGDRLLGFAWWR